MKIAIAGSRGIPNQYGGFEQFAERISAELQSRGHEVVVYGSTAVSDRSDEFNGVKIIRKYDPEPWLGPVGQFIYDLNCILDSRRREFDIILQLGYTSSSVWFRLHPKKSRVITNMDGLEWMRSKYGHLSRLFLKRAEKLAVCHSHALIADSKEIQSYLEGKYQRQAHYLSYGADIPSYPPEIPSIQDIEPGKYILNIARIQPDNHTQTILEAWMNATPEIPLLITGNTRHSFAKKLMRRYAHPQIHFTGGLYNKELLNGLRYHSALYIHGHSCGGTNPALLEAIACRCRIIAHDNPFNREVLGQNALYFSNTESLAALLPDKDSNDVWEKRIENNLQTLYERYQWKNIADSLCEIMV